MSLDFYLNEVRPTDVFWANYTHNVVPMWAKAGCYDALYYSDGKKASEVLPNLLRGQKAMQDDPAAYIALNPKNGWGSYDTAMKFLGEVIAACQASPDAVIRVSA